MRPFLDQGVVVLNDLTEVVGDHEVADLAVLDVDALGTRRWNHLGVQTGTR